MSDEAREPPRDARLERFLDEYGSLLRNTIARLCPRHLGIQFDDIEQEARLRLWRALRTATEIANPAGFVYRVAASATIDAVRRATARREEQLRLRSEGEEEEEGPLGLRHPLSGPDASPEGWAARRLLIRRAEVVLAALSPDRRRAVALFLRGFSPPEIGSLLGWSEPKARSAVYRGLAELRARLREQGVEDELGSRRPEPAV